MWHHATICHILTAAMRFLAFLLLFVSGIAPAAPSISGGGENVGAAYVALDPFVVNLKDGTRVRFMQVKMQVMASNPTVQEAVTLHMPAVRDRLIMLFAHQDAAALRTLQGREGLRQEALTAVQGVVSEVTTTTPKQKAAIEAVYFTDFVIQ
ncbi:MAG: flagellar basal body-associated protein FliL [Thiohalomonadaceae bacterium]